MARRFQNMDFRGISPQKYLAVTILAVFVGELLIMLLIDLMNFESKIAEALFDASMISLALFLINYLLMARPLIFYATALQEADERLRDAIESTNEGFVLFDSNDRLALCNDKYREMYGPLGEQLVPGNTFEDIIREGMRHGVYPEAKGNEEEWLAERLNLHRNPPDTPFQQRLPDGRWVLVRERQTSDGGIVGIRTDITDLKNTENELNANQDVLERHIRELLATRKELEANNQQLRDLADDLARQREKAESANMAKSQFLSIMSHELRTPLNAVLGFSEIIRDQLFGPVGSQVYLEYARDIYNSGTHLLLLVDDILDMSRIESGAYKPDYETFPLCDVVRDSMRLLEGRANANKVRLVAKPIEENLELTADKRAVKQMLINLLTNAVKFNKENGEVTLSCQSDDDWHKIAVRDNGIGVDEADLLRVMEPFAQIEREKGRIHEGAGLGLPLTKSLIEAHGGKIDFFSKKGEGTTATLYFPATPDIQTPDSP